MPNSPEVDLFLDKHNSHGWVRVPNSEVQFPFLADSHYEYECPCNPGYHFTVHQKADAQAYHRTFKKSTR